MSDEPLDVRRVDDENGTHIEPPLNGVRRSDHERLRWSAGVLLVDHDLTVRVRQVRRGRFALYGDGWGISDAAFDVCWTYMNGMGQGARLARR